MLSVGAPVHGRHSTLPLHQRSFTATTIREKKKKDAPMKNRNTKEQKQAIKENDEKKGRSDKEKQSETTRP